MITLADIRAAAAAPDPYAQMDRLVRAELAGGRRVRDIVAEVGPLVDPVLETPGLTEDGEEAFLQTLSALLGQCPRSQAYQDPPAAMPAFPAGAPARDPRQAG